MTNTLPLTIDRQGRELTITGRFRLRKEQNGNPKWVLKLKNTIWHGSNPTIACSLLRAEPTFNNDIGISVFDFNTEVTASHVAEQLVTDGLADTVAKRTAPYSHEKMKWDNLKESFEQGAKKYLGSFPTPPAGPGYINGGQAKSVDALEKAMVEAYQKTPPSVASRAAVSRRRAQEAHRITRGHYPDPVAIHKLCDECGGSGFYEGFAKSEPCSRGCKAPS